MEPSSTDLTVWISRLRAAAAPGLGQPIPEHSELARQAWVEGFVDDHGNRPDITTPFLTWCARLRVVDAPTHTPDAPPDSMLWWALSDPRIDPSRFLNQQDQGPILHQAERTSIEVWTERELCGLHAFSRLALAGSRADWESRCFRCVDWLMNNLQPDNATNHPWAIHVFVIAARAGNPDADMYAQTLLHNCQVNLGRADRLSAYILRDASEFLTERF